jgi:hypothetical protein
VSRDRSHDLLCKARTAPSYFEYQDNCKAVPFESKMKDTVEFPQELLVESPIIVEHMEADDLSDSMRLIYDAMLVKDREDYA